MFSPLDILEGWKWDKVPKEMKPHLVYLKSTIESDDEEAKFNLWQTIEIYAGIREAVIAQLEECIKCPKQPLTDEEEGCASC